MYILFWNKIEKLHLAISEDFAPFVQIMIKFLREKIKYREGDEKQKKIVLPSS